MFATLNGVRTYYETMGSGPTLIAVHGGPGLSDHRAYLPYLEPLADRYRVVLYDLRGCGQSDDPADGSYSHADFVADLDALRSHLGVEQFALTGVSYGGFISLEYALVHGDRLTHLILQDTSPSNESDEASKQTALDSGLPMDPELLDAIWYGTVRDDEQFRESFAQILPLYRHTPDPEEDAAKLAQMTFRHRAHNYAFAHNIPNYDLRARLGEIHVPTLIICGRSDWITPLRDSEFMAEHIPNAEFTVFENSGHGPMIEENDAFIDRVRAFLQNGQVTG